MIEITHSSDDGYVARGVSHDDGSAEIIEAADWCWSRHLDAWQLPGSRDQTSKMPVVEATVVALRRAGIEVALL